MSIRTRGILAALASLALVLLLAACMGDESLAIEPTPEAAVATPGPVDTPAPAPEATPAPEPDPTPTPEPTPPATPDEPLEEEPAFFEGMLDAEEIFDSITIAEQQCIVAAIGEDRLDSIKAGAPLRAQESEAIVRCLSSETLGLIFVAQFEMLAGPLSPQTRACVQAKIEGIDMDRLARAGQLDAGQLDKDEMLNLLGTVFCLTEEERASLDRAEHFGPLMLGSLITQVECLKAVLDRDDLDAIIEDPEGSDRLREAVVLCQVSVHGPAGEPMISTDQIVCLDEQLRGRGLMEMFKFGEDPARDAAIHAALAECGIDLKVMVMRPPMSADDDPAAGLPFTAQELECLRAELGEEAFDRMLEQGHEDPDAAVLRALWLCGIDITDIDFDGDPAAGVGGMAELERMFTEVEIRCLFRTISIEDLQGLMDGTADPFITLLPALQACNVGLDRILNG